MKRYRFNFFCFCNRLQFICLSCYWRKRPNLGKFMTGWQVVTPVVAVRVILPLLHLLRLARICPARLIPELGYVYFIYFFGHWYIRCPANFLKNYILRQKYAKIKINFMAQFWIQLKQKIVLWFCYLSKSILSYHHNLIRIKTIEIADTRIKLYKKNRNKLQSWRKYVLYLAVVSVRIRADTGVRHVSEYVKLVIK